MGQTETGTTCGAERERREKVRNEKAEKVNCEFTIVEC